MAQLPQIDSLRRPNAAASAASKPRRFPWLHLPLAIVITLLVGYGLIIVYSAVRADGDYQYSRQLGGVAVGLIFMILVWRFDYRRLSDYTTLFLIINVVLIMSPHIPGLGTDAGMGARSWIKLGMQIQPGEFAKITVILMDAAVMARYGGNLDDPREYVKALGIMMVPFVCIMTQPDLGTGLVYLCIAAFALVMGGANTKYLLITLGLFMAAVVAVFAIDEVIKSSTGEYKLLKQYQRNRLLVFMDQSGTATTDEGYNLQQAKVAIGSGGLFGMGLGLGRPRNIPLYHSDFIFAAIAEEFGLLFSICLLAVYVLIIMRGLVVAMNARTSFHSLTAFGIVAMLGLQTMLIVGGNTKLIPLTGVTLPLISSGGSSLVSTFLSFGILLGISSMNAEDEARDIDRLELREEAAL